MTATYTPTPSFEENWSFQLGYYRIVETILKDNARYFINVSVANQELDTKQATDFVIKLEGGDIAVRIRRDDCKYRDLTIRSINHGYKTEIDKIREGFGKYYLYCWTDSTGEVSEWILVDLDKVRNLNLMDNRRDIPNGDGTYFIAISKKELNNNDCLLASKGGE